MLEFIFVVLHRSGDRVQILFQGRCTLLLGGGDASKFHFWSRKKLQCRCYWQCPQLFRAFFFFSSVSRYICLLFIIHFYFLHEYELLVYDFVCQIFAQIEYSPEGLPNGWVKLTKFRKFPCEHGTRKDPVAYKLDFFSVTESQLLLLHAENILVELYWLNSITNFWFCYYCFKVVQCLLMASKIKP